MQARLDHDRVDARALGEVLRDPGFAPYAMTTGSRGLHVVVRYAAAHRSDDARAFTRTIAGGLA